jgi:Rieske Fe-S protein
MPGDDQERFEDYLKLEQFITTLQAGQAVRPPQELTPTQARVYKMARLFHTATPEANEPRPEFAAHLQERLEKELHLPPDRRQSPPLRIRRVSRRMLLAGGATAAASVAVGAGLDHVLEQQTPSGEVQVSGPPMNWFFVTTVSELGNQAIQFKSESLIGYVVRSDGTNGDPSEKGQLIAMSAACTHKGCIVQWSGADRKFHCPCHDGLFTEDGGTDAGAASALLYLDPLPRLDVKVEGEKIYVRMPASI